MEPQSPKDKLSKPSPTLLKLRLQPQRHALAAKNQLHPLLLVKSENISMLKDRSWYQSQLNTAKLELIAQAVAEQTTSKLLAHLTTPTVSPEDQVLPNVSLHALTQPVHHQDQVQLQELLQEPK